jgi:hypothetical protein
MRRIFLLALLVVIASGPAAFCGDEEFNGRWDIKTLEERPRAWWLEIDGAGTPTPKGKFISAFGGDLNVIEEISIRAGELRFGWMRQEQQRGGQETVTRHLVYTARLVNGELEGTYQVENQAAGAAQPPVIRWAGVRAPAIDDKDDGTWREGKPVELFNGKDLSGWVAVTGAQPVGWSVKEGALASTGRGQDIASTQKFWNFLLHVEFRIGERSNSGMALRNRYEVQILEDHGRTPNAHSAGALYSRIAPSENASKPANEWQTYDIRLVGRQVTVVFNGKKVLDRGTIEGLTAMAHDSDEALPGPLSLQGDHGPVEFRKITVTPLVK